MDHSNSLHSDAQPVLLQATCALPDHACGPVIRKGFRDATPVLIRHVQGSGTTSFRLLANRPWEVTAGARLGALAVFEVYASSNRLPAGARASVTPAVVEVVGVPDAVADAFTRDLLEALRFERAV